MASVGDGALPVPGVLSVIGALVPPGGINAVPKPGLSCVAVWAMLSALRQRIVPENRRPDCEQREGLAGAAARSAGGIP